MHGHEGDEDTAVDLKLYSHRWRRWLPSKPRNMDSNRASQEQEPEADGFPGILSAEDTDNSSKIEVIHFDWLYFESHCIMSSLSCQLEMIDI